MRLAILALTLAASSCSPLAGPDLASPGLVSSIQLWPLTVAVKVRGSDSPLAGATVLAGVQTCTTAASGLCTLSLPSRTLTRVAVSADGFQGFSAEGTLTTDHEVWTFYLERLD